MDVPRRGLCTSTEHVILACKSCFQEVEHPDMDSCGNKQEGSKRASGAAGEPLPPCPFSAHSRATTADAYVIQ
jgi:hypothetical protein